MRKLAAFAWLLALDVAIAQSPGVFGQSSCERCGVVVSIEVATQREDWVPLGVVPVAPMLASAQPGETSSMFAFGRGDPTVVTIGPAGGAVYAKRAQSYQKRRWDVTVAMDDGSRRILPQRYEPFLREGDRVRVSGTQIELVH